MFPPKKTCWTLVLNTRQWIGLPPVYSQSWVRLFEFNFHWPQLSWAKVKAFPNSWLYSEKSSSIMCCSPKIWKKTWSLVHWWHSLKLILSASRPEFWVIFAPQRSDSLDCLTHQLLEGLPITQGGMCQWNHGWHRCAKFLLFSDPLGWIPGYPEAKIL